MSAKKPLKNGKNGLTPTETNLTNILIPTPSEALKEKLASVYNYFNSVQKRKVHTQRREWFVFHMTDWLHDFEKLQQLYDHPESVSDEEANEIVAGLLYHAVNHLLAASRLLLQHTPEDIFMEHEENRSLPSKP
ncbi:MAG: hypothetical protein ACK4RK_15595 [Gemmataceae bacterium]